MKKYRFRHEEEVKIVKYAVLSLVMSTKSDMSSCKNSQYIRDKADLLLYLSKYLYIVSLLVLYEQNKQCIFTCYMLDREHKQKKIKID